MWGERIQQLEVWTPGELEMFLFSVYSPVHALLWMATNSTNWMMMLVVMFLTGVQVSILSTFLSSLFIFIFRVMVVLISILYFF